MYLCYTHNYWADSFWSVLKQSQWKPVLNSSTDKHESSGVEKHRTKHRLILHPIILAPDSIPRYGNPY